MAAKAERLITVACPNAESPNAMLCARFALLGGRRVATSYCVDASADASVERWSLQIAAVIVALLT